jgi:plastocyanin
MSRIALLITGLALAVAVAASSVGASMAGSKMAPAKLTGITGPGFTITLKKRGVKVKTLKAGRYTITVSDKSTEHNFRLKGPGLNKQITGILQKGTRTVTVTFRKGTYTYVCDPHDTQMKGSFRVT